jgi:hypothetical protein
MRRRRALISAWAIVVLAGAVSAAPGAGLRAIDPRELKEWLSYIASDELQGRALYSTGLGLAAAYIQDHLRSSDLRPAGDGGSYLQTVRVQGVKATSRSTVTLDIGGETRTFAESHGITFPKNAGGKRRFTIDRVEFAGYGLDAPGAGYSDFKDRDMTGAAVVWLGQMGPKGIDSGAYRRLLGTRSRRAIDVMGAAAGIGPASSPTDDADDTATATGAAGRGGRGAPIPVPDFTTVERLDIPVAPRLTANDDFFEFLFSRAPIKYGELKKKSEAQDPLPAFRLEGVKITFNVDVDYDIVRTQLTQNVVAIVEGSDPQLKNSYVALGAHYDHVGYAEGEVRQGPNGPQRQAAPGRVTAGQVDDRIWNGADDDGTGTVAMMALAKVFQAGARPKRSLLFVWHAGEERGLLGSRYYADHPTVPISSIVAQLNIDMVGRNRDNKPTESNTVYLVGSDRISTELDVVIRAANRSLPSPMMLDYEFNDPADLEDLYTRSDHYSYAVKGIPVTFFTTGLHPDYHANTDEVSKIDFEKMTHVAQLIYETAWRLANLDHVPVRDHKGPRAGKGTKSE